MTTEFTVRKVKNYNMTIVSRILLKFFARIIHAYEQNSARNLNCKISWPQLINWWSLIGEWGECVTTHYSKAKLFQEATVFNVIFTYTWNKYMFHLKLNHTLIVTVLWLFWSILISYCKFFMPRPLKWGILGARTIILTEDI